MKFKLTNHFEGYDLESVYQAFLQKDFHTYKSRMSGGKNVEVLEHVHDNDSFSISIKSTIQSEAFKVEVPRFLINMIDPSYGVTRLIGQEAMTMVYTESWPVNGAAVKDGTFRITLEGVPAEINGTTSISPQVGGCREDVAAFVDVKIPLVGSLVTGYFVTSLKNDFKTNHEMALLYLQEQAGV